MVDKSVLYATFKLVAYGRSEMNARIDNACLVLIETQLKSTKNGIEKGILVRILVFPASNPTVVNFLSTIRNNFWLLSKLCEIDREIERSTNFDQGQGRDHE